MPALPPALHGLDLKLFPSIFALIFMAELPDKTAFAAMMLATRKHPRAVFLGVAAAFAVQSAVAVGFGGVLSLLPARWVRMGAGAMFLVFAYMLWRRDEAEEEKEAHVDIEKRASFLKTAWASFVAIFLMEWGDLTQLATATLAAKHKSPVTVFLAATSALWTVSALAILIGNRAKTLLKPALIQRISAIAFCLVGITLLIRG